MYMMKNKLDCVDLEECTETDGTLTLEEVWKPKKNITDKKLNKISKYFGPAVE